MRPMAVLLAVVLLALAGCGDDSAESDGGAQPADDAAGAADATETSANQADSDAGSKRDEDRRERKRRDGTEITVGDSQFGRMLFDSNEQAIYIFENDRSDETVCYGECAEAWPPVLTDGPPQAGKGVDRSLLGTIKRRGGDRQVTYDGQPLYFYVDEAPGEVRCHNVDLNGGLWWVVGPDGERLP